MSYIDQTPVYPANEVLPADVDAVPVKVVNPAAEPIPVTIASVDPLIVTGEDTPSDDRLNPTGNVATTAFGMVWSAAESLWGRMRGLANGILRVAADEGQYSVTVSTLTTIPNASTLLLAAGAGEQGRRVRIAVPSQNASGKAQAVGVHLNFGAAATTANMYLEPGHEITVNTIQAINAIKGAALFAANPVVSVTAEVPTA